MKKKVEDVRVKTKKEKRWLPYHYSEAEINTLGKVLASLSVRCVEMNQDLETMKAEHKSAEKDKEREVTAEEGKRNEMAGNIKRGFESRDIECEIRYDYDTNIKTIVRLDTGEVIEDGIIPEYERQIALPLEDPESQKELDDVAANG